MKKIVALLLTLVMLTGLTVTALAAGEKTGTTKLTAVVPDSDYTIHVPADMTLEYGNTSEQEIGKVSVTIVSGTFDLDCSVYGSALKNGSNYIPVTYHLIGEFGYADETKTVTGESTKIYSFIVFEYNDGNSYYKDIDCKVKVDNWTAEPGTYTATMTFNFSY